MNSKYLHSTHLLFIQTYTTYTIYRILTSDTMLRRLIDFRGQNPIRRVKIPVGLAGDRQNAAALAVEDHDVAALATDEVARPDLVLFVALIIISTS